MNKSLAVSCMAVSLSLSLCGQTTASQITATKGMDRRTKGMDRREPFSRRHYCPSELTHLVHWNVGCLLTTRVLEHAISNRLSPTRNHVRSAVRPVGTSTLGRKERSGDNDEILSATYPELNFRAGSQSLQTQGIVREDVNSLDNRLVLWTTLPCARPCPSCSVSLRL